MDAMNPLPESRLPEINQAIQNAENALAGIAKARLAGLDMTAEENQLNDALKRLRLIKNVYFPGR